MPRSRAIWSHQRKMDTESTPKRAVSPTKMPSSSPLENLASVGKACATSPISERRMSSSQYVMGMAYPTGRSHAGRISGTNGAYAFASIQRCYYVISPSSCFQYHVVSSKISPMVQSTPHTGNMFCSYCVWLPSPRGESSSFNRKGGI